jgi:HSP20 family molecular chaperone IbpA
LCYNIVGWQIQLESANEKGRLIMYIENFFRELDGLFNERAYQGFKSDVLVIENGYQIIGEVLGAKKEDININYEDGILTVEANINVDDQQEYLMRERMSRTLRRTFSLGDIDEESIKAKYENGLIMVSVNFKEEVKKEKKSIIIE